ncbi:MAG: nucleotidyl transferase [Phycisphaeraceae bacterium]|nr:MAG: nucleotidyl transferase [Phycisphaeraceae bacterium]
MTGSGMTSGRTVRKAVITAAGRGTRQYPASSAVQKEMFPLVDTDGLTKTVIQIIGEEAIRAGVEEICLVTQPGDEGLYADYFQGMTEETFAAFEGKDWAIAAAEQLADFGRRLHFVSQDSPQGYGHAVYQAKDFVGDEPFLHLLGDHVYVAAAERCCAQQLIDTFEAGGFDALSAVQATPERLLHLFGTIKGSVVDGPEVAVGKPGHETWRVDAIEEKPTIERARAALRTPGLPAGHYLCHFGMHVFPPAIFESLAWHIDHDIRVGGEIQLTNAQELMRAEILSKGGGSGRYGACRIAGRRFDTGIPYGLMETQIALALAGRHRGEIVESIALLLAEHLAPLARKQR